MRLVIAFILVLMLLAVGVLLSIALNWLVIVSPLAMTVLTVILVAAVFIFMYREISTMSKK